MSAINENIYDVTLISKIKEQTGPKKLKKINRSLRNLIEDDVKGFSGLKIKKFEEKEEEENKFESENHANNTIQHHFIEDLNKSNSNQIFDNDDEHEAENTTATLDDNEILKKINFSDSSADE